MAKFLRVEFSDGSRWEIPVSIIAEDRAKEYAHEFDGSAARSLAEDTGPLFDASPYSIKDWAKNNMNWSEVVAHAVRTGSRTPSYEDEWGNADCEIVEREV
jgi:hypothetical protein